MKICITGKIYDAQNDKTVGMVVTRNGKVVAKTSRAWGMVVSEFKRVATDNAYAAREAASRS